MRIHAISILDTAIDLIDLQCVGSNILKVAEAQTIDGMSTILLMKDSRTLTSITLGGDDDT